ncbi:MAG: hypothetical protein KDB40_14965 [Acidimicrobiales bacterium]|nr:hypothetical protein [Acidimicrobiales bacterium]
MKRTQRATLTLAAVAALLPFTAAACGGDDDSSDGGGDGISAAEMAELFVEAGAPDDEAECVGEALEGKVSREQIEQFLGSADGTDLDEDLLATIGTAVGTCTA